MARFRDFRIEVRTDIHLQCVFELPIVSNKMKNEKQANIKCKHHCLQDRSGRWVFVER